MLAHKTSKLAGLALAGTLAVGFAGAASAQDWSQPAYAGQTTYRGVHHHVMHYRYSYPQTYDYGYQREGYYQDGYDGYRDGGTVAAAGAVVGSAADTAAAVATGYPYGDGYYGPGTYYEPAAYYGGYGPNDAYGDNPEYGNDWWGSRHAQYENSFPQYQNDGW